MYFIFCQTQAPIYLFCDDFFKYIGPWVCADFGVADSLSKMGAGFKILSELVPKLGAMANRTVR